MSLSSNILTRATSSFDVIGVELDAMTAGLSGVSPHPQTPEAYCISKPKRTEVARRFGCVELLLDDWTNPSDPYPIGALFCFGGEPIWIEGTSDVEIATAFIAVLCDAGSKVNLVAMWNGFPAVFHTFLRHLARPLTELGYKVIPWVTGVDIKAIVVRGNGKSWTMMDANIASGLTKGGAEGFSESFGGGFGPTLTRVQRLYSAVERFQIALVSISGVALRPTMATAAAAAMRNSLPEGVRWFRPNLGLESVCRAGGAYRGGYVYSEEYQGGAWRIDVNRMYTNLLRSGLPASSAFGHAGEYLRERRGIFLCRIEGEGHFPAYISSFTPSDGRFHKQNTTRPAAFAFLPSAELPGLRALGYHIEAGLGFQFTTWVSLRPFAEKLLKYTTHKATPPAERLVCKAIGNSLTGKLGQSPDRLDVCYSIEKPSEGWVPFVTVEREVIDGLWINRHTHYSGSQHVDAAAWLTAQGRGTVYSQLARVKALGWRAVHVDTDGIILDSDPTQVLSLHSSRPGAWRFDGYDERAVVAKGKWYSFKGETHTAGLSGVTREQLEAVISGRHVVIGRNVLTSPFSKGPLYRAESYRFGEG